MAEDSLSSPLLSDHTILNIPESPSPTPPFHHSSNLYALLGAQDLFEVPETSSIDPFRNHTGKIESLYEWVKIVVCLPIVVLRLVLFGVCLVVGYVATKCALFGWKDKHNPMPRWRCRIMWITRISARCILFCFGYHWIKRRGKPAPRDVAPIVVSNHVSYIEPIFFFFELFPTIVASESHDSMPFVGDIIRAMQVIYVNRFSQSSRKQATSEIKRKASSDQFPRVLLFPEGTTTNGRCLISFQLGAFIANYPVQPVVVRYPHVHFDQSWGLIGVAKLMLRMFTQFHNFMEVEYLPVISPDNQKGNAARFSQMTSRAMATSLNVIQTSYTYGDLMLLNKAADCKQENPSLYMVEMERVASIYNINSLEAVGFLDVFLSMGPDSSGHVDIHDFLRVLRLKQCNLSEKMFGFIDQQKIGKITFKQFLIGSAYILKQPLFEHCCNMSFKGCEGSRIDFILEEEFGDSVVLAIPNSNNNEIHALFTLFDTDHDGMICKDEFLSCMRRNPLLIALFFPLITRRGLSITTHSLVEEMV